MSRTSSTGAGTPDQPGRHLMDGSRCARCGGQELDLDIYTADPGVCPPRWLDDAELAARDAAYDAQALLDSKACAACGSLRHGVEDCV